MKKKVFLEKSKNSNKSKKFNLNFRLFRLIRVSKKNFFFGK